MPRRILIVDDEPLKRITLRIELSELGYDVTEAPDAHSAVRILDGKPIDLVVSDVRMPGPSGLDLLTHVKRLRPTTEVILMTAYAEVDAAVAAIKRGAHDYITKPFTTQDLVTRIERLFAGKPQLEADGELERFGALLGRTQSVRKLFCQARTLAEQDRPVLICGEPGVGKNALAEALHAAGRRRESSLTLYQCTTADPVGIEADLFGSLEATDPRRRSGRLEQCAGGVFVLDDVETLPAGAQARLLRLIERREIDGGNGVATQVDLQLICTTRRQPPALVQDCGLREDLFFRLNSALLQVPSLRDRLDDIPVLAQHFVERLGNGARSIAPVATELLLKHRWPGNVRELENVIERALMLAEGGEIRPEHIVLFSSETGNMAPPGLEIADSGSGLSETMADIERRLILLALRQCEGNQAKAAHKLGIPRTTLRDKMAKYSLTGE